MGCGASSQKCKAQQVEGSDLIMELKPVQGVTTDEVKATPGVTETTPVTVGTPVDMSQETVPAEAAESTPQEKTPAEVSFSSRLLVLAQQEATDPRSPAAVQQVPMETSTEPTPKETTPAHAFFSVPAATPAGASAEPAPQEATTAEAAASAQEATPFEALALQETTANEAQTEVVSQEAMAAEVPAESTLEATPAEAPAEPAPLEATPNDTPAAAPDATPAEAGLTRSSTVREGLTA